MKHMDAPPGSSANHNKSSERQTITVLTSIYLYPMHTILAIKAPEASDSNVSMFWMEQILETYWDKFNLIHNLCIQ